MASHRSWALVTGASRGIGRALALEFARHGVDVAITAEEELATVEAEVAATGVQVRAIRADLRSYEGVEQLWTGVSSVADRIEFAALNAGIGVGGGSFVDTDLDAHLDVIRLDVLGTVHLARRVLDAMNRAGRGRLLITSSMVAAMPGPYQVTYNAAKSFLQSFAVGLQAELRGGPLTVTSLMPGPVDTDFFRRADMLGTRLGQARKDDPDLIARQAYRALLRGDRRVVGGSLVSQAMARVNTVLPDRVKSRMQEILSKPKS